MSNETIRIGLCGRGYEQIEISTEEGLERLPHHRVLSTVWGDLDSALFSEDLREVHHEIGIEWYNVEDNLEALSPAEHKRRDPGRARIRTPWESIPEGSR